MKSSKCSEDVSVCTRMYVANVETELQFLVTGMLRNYGSYYDELHSVGSSK